MRSFCKLIRTSHRIERSDLPIPLDGRVAAEAGMSYARLQCKEYAVKSSLTHHARQHAHHAEITSAQTVRTPVSAPGARDA